MHGATMKINKDNRFMFCEYETLFLLLCQEHAARKQ